MAQVQKIPARYRPAARARRYLVRDVRVIIEREQLLILDDVAVPLRHVLEPVEQLVQQPPRRAVNDGLRKRADEKRAEMGAEKVTYGQFEYLRLVFVFHHQHLDGIARFRVLFHLPVRVV